MSDLYAIKKSRNDGGAHQYVTGYEFETRSLVKLEIMEAARSYAAKYADQMAAENSVVITPTGMAVVNFASGDYVCFFWSCRGE